MKRFICMAVLCMALFTITACKNSQNGQNSNIQAEDSMSILVHSNIETEEPISQPETSDSATMEYYIGENGINKEESVEMKVSVQVGNIDFIATLENNAAVDALVEMMEKEPVVIQMSDYSGFEKVGSLGKRLPANNSQITTEAGDIVLYQGNQIVIFYGSNSWSYTRIGRIDDLTGWEEALGSGDVIVTFSLRD